MLFLVTESYEVQLEIVVSLLNDGADVRNEHLLRRIAFYSGNVEVAQLLLDRGAPLVYQACENAYIRGHVELIELFLQHGPPMDSDYVTFSDAISGRRLEMIRMFLKRGQIPKPIWRKAVQHAHDHQMNDVLSVLLEFESQYEIRRPPELIIIK